MRLPCLALALLCLAAPAGAVAPAADLLLRDVTVIDGSGAPPRAGQSILVRDGRIAAIGDTARVVAPPGATVIDGRGRFVIPGLRDAHLHLAVRPEPELAEKVALPLLLAHGVVAARDMGAPLERALALRAAVREGRIAGPDVATPGPFVDGAGEADPAFRRVGAPADAGAVVAELKAAGVDFVKVQAGLTGEALADVVAAARGAGMAVAGHVPERVDALAVAKLGLRSLEHVSPALPGDAGLMLACSPRTDALRAELRAIAEAAAQPGADRAALRVRNRKLQDDLLAPCDPARFDALARALREQGTIVVPTLVWSKSFRPVAAADTGEDVPLQYVFAAMRDGWKRGRAGYLGRATAADFDLDARTAARSAALVGELHRAGVKIAAGTDAIDAFTLPGDSLHRELELLVQAGLSPLEAITAATLRPAEILGLEQEQGTLAAGRRADLVLLEADPLADIRNTRRIAAVVKAGVLHDRAALDALLAGVEAAGR